jgi:hypothetical protein
MISKKEYFQRGAWVSFFTAFTTLAAQVLVCRIISAKLFNNYAFLVISLTMLGFALSGVILTFNPSLMKRLRKNIHVMAWFFTLTLLGGTALFYRLPISLGTYHDNVSYVLEFLRFFWLACLFVLPFSCCGLILGILLTHPRLPTRKIYGFDLAGSSIGALLVVVAIIFAGVEKSLLILCGLFLLGLNINFPIRSKLNLAVLTVIVTGMAVLYMNSSEAFRMKAPKLTRLDFLDSEYVQWDPIARMVVSNMDLLTLDPKKFDLDFSMLGSDKKFYGHIKKFFSQNNNAGTWAFYYNGDKSSLKGIEKTLYWGAYRATSVPSPKVLVIGMGAGMDILTALHANAHDVTGVEINGATHNILRNVYREYFKHWVDDPRVRMVHDEGRHYLSKVREKYDVIEVTGVDSYSGTIASANIFSENYLYTKEAIKLYYKKLTDNGVAHIIRLEYPDPPREMVRMLATAMEALREEGIDDPSQHIVMFANTWLTGASMLIKKKPFTSADIQNLTDWTSSNPNFKIASTTDFNHTWKSVYHDFLELKDKQKEDAFISQYPVDIRPVDDDRPFFFRYTRWGDLFKRGPLVPVFELNIVVLLLILSLICAGCIMLPLQRLAGSVMGETQKERYILIFSCLGVGYFFIEIAFIQKLGLFLGHPNYAISVVLSGLLLATGIGSMYAKDTVKRFKNIGNVTLVLSMLVLAEALFILPNLKFLIQLDMVIKWILAGVVLFPVGFLLGVYLPESIEQLKKVYPSYVPWAWGINGIFSVLAPVAAVGLSVTFGFKFLFICSVPFYLIASNYLSLEQNAKLARSSPQGAGASPTLNFPARHPRDS